MSSFASTLQASRASGKRTLSDQYDRETTAKRQKLAKDSVDESFDQDGKCSTSIPVSSSSRICNTVVFDDDKEDLEELEGLDEVCEAFQFPMKQEVDMVQQEEGYLSPPISSPGRMDGENGSQRDATPDFSSPLQWRTNAALVQRRKVGPQTTPRLGGNGMGATLASQTAELDDESSQWDSDDRVTSPPTALKHHAEVSNKMEVEQSQLYISELLASNAQSTKNPSCDTFTVDLCDIFVDTGGSEIDTEISSPGTALEEEPIECARARLDDVDDDEAALRMLQRHKVVAAGWEQKFSNTPRLGFHDKGGKPTTTTVQKRAKVGFASVYCVKSGTNSGVKRHGPGSRWLDAILSPLYFTQEFLDKLIGHVDLHRSHLQGIGLLAECFSPRVLHHILGADQRIWT